MTATERHRKWLARKLANAKPPAPVAGDLILKVAHVRLDQIGTAVWLCRQLDHNVAVAFHDALGRAIEGG